MSQAQFFLTHTFLFPSHHCFQDWEVTSDLQISLSKPSQPQLLFKMKKKSFRFIVLGILEMFGKANLQ